MRAIPVKEGLWQICAVDWNIREFHGYSTYKGTTYNSYLALGEKKTLFDGSKKEFADDFLSEISQITDPSSIDYLVINHAEPDHSGALPAIIEKVKPEKIFCSETGKKTLLAHYHNASWPFEVVKDGQEFDIGGRSVQFLETRMLHWPDSCFSYLKEDGVLISSDAFGQHWATSGRFDDEVELGELLHHAAKYYANIIFPYSPMVVKVMERLKSLNLPIEIIAPDHGLMWRKNIPAVLNSYGKWSRQELRDKAVVFYDTMWKSTEKMANALMEGLMEQGFEVEMMSMKRNHRSDVITEILDAKVIAAGSPTLNNGLLPTIYDMLYYMKGLKPRGRIGGVFGSYGWSGESVQLMKSILESFGTEVIEPNIRVNYVPVRADLENCRQLGRNLALRAKNI